MVHGEDQRRADATRAHQSQNRRFPDVYVEAVQHRRGQRREQLGEHGVPDAEQEGDAHGFQGVIGPEVQRLNGLREPFAQKAHAANAQGKHAGKGAGTGHPNKDQAVDQKGDRADRHDDHPEQQRRELWHQAEGREEGQGHCDNCSGAGAHQSDAHGLQQQVPQAAGIRLKEESPVGVEQAGNHGLHRPGADMGEVRGLERQRTGQN